MCISPILIKTKEHLEGAPRPPKHSTFISEQTYRRRYKYYQSYVKQKRFRENNNLNTKDIYGYRLVPCGKCIQCRQAKQRDMLERGISEYLNCGSKGIFLTLTYSQEPVSQGANLLEVQRFLKRLRKQTKLKIRYIAVGEYGTKTRRIHAHMVLFGYVPQDMTPLGQSNRKQSLFTSSFVSHVWGHGRIAIGQVTEQSIKYCMQYTAKSRYFRVSDNCELYHSTRRLLSLARSGAIPVTRLQYTEMMLKQQLLRIHEFSTNSHDLGHMTSLSSTRINVHQPLSKSTIMRKAIRYNNNNHNHNQDYKDTILELVDRTNRANARVFKIISDLALPRELTMRCRSRSNERIRLSILRDILSEYSKTLQDNYMARDKVTSEYKCARYNENNSI